MGVHRLRLLSCDLGHQGRIQWIIHFGLRPRGLSICIRPIQVWPTTYQTHFPDPSVPAQISPVIDLTDTFPQSDTVTVLTQQAAARGVAWQLFDQPSSIFTDFGKSRWREATTVDDDDVVSCQKWHPSPASYIGRYDASGPNINRWWWVRWWVLEDLPSWKHRGVRDLEGFFSIWLTFMGWMWVAGCFRSEKLELHPCVSIFLLFRMQHDAGTYI